MTTSSIANPVLSSSFDPARKLSRIMATIFTIGFWGAVVMTVCLPLILILPLEGSLNLNGTIVRFADLPLQEQILGFLAAVVNLVPAAFLLHHTRRAFRAFADGAVFAPATIGQIRSAGIWLIVCFFGGVVTVPLMIGAGLHEPGQIPLDFWPLIIGVTTFIAAHVMAEAARIAAENAEIV